MDVPGFIRAYHIRAPQIMWFLGAGASAAAKIPTAGAMIWDFKRRLYCSAQRVPLESCRDLGSPELRARLQSYFDGLTGFPPLNDPEEYAAYFEAVYPDDGDRRRYIERLVEGGVPSFGHMALTALVVNGSSRVVWTTNFDRVIDEALLPAAGGPTRVTVATPDAGQVALDALNEGRWPLLVKLHGDFQSRRLKNTRDELREQDTLLRRALLQACRSGGLAVVGYSGRDESVMRVLERALEEDGEPAGAFPAGLFWFHRASDGPPLPRVVALVERATALGVDAHVIQVETFDELMGDVAGHIESPSDAVRGLLAARPSHVTDAPVPAPGDSYPIVRLNALPITALPTVCRRIECTIGNTSAVRAAVVAANADLVVARKRVGVLAFGRDAEARRAFAGNAVTTMDLHPIDERRLLYDDSAEWGMLLDALARAVSRERPVRAQRRRGRYLLIIEPARAAGSQAVARLRRGAQQLEGRHRVTNGLGEPEELAWAEAVAIRIERRLGRTWLLLEPTVWIERATDEVGVHAAASFVRERRASRYNNRTSELLDAWVDIVTGGADEARVSAFGLAQDEGVDATFGIGRTTAFSRAVRVQAVRAPALAAVVGDRQHDHRGGRRSLSQPFSEGR